MSDLDDILEVLPPANAKIVKQALKDLMLELADEVMKNYPTDREAFKQKVQSL